MLELHDPHFQNMREVYKTAIKELATPFPATQVQDWSILNKYTGGFRPREFSIFCGAPGTGKTQWLASLSAQLLKQKTKHFVMSVETGHTDYMKRIMSYYAGEDLNGGDAIEASRLSKIHADNMNVFSSGDIEFALYEDRIPVEQLQHDIEFMVKQRGCKIAIVDNLNFFMEVCTNDQQFKEMDRVIHSLIIFCKKIDVHIIMVMHPRKTEDDGRITSMYDIRGSAAAVMEAHNVFLFNRVPYADITSGKRNAFERELLIKKMRRRGKYTNKIIVFNALEGVRYEETGST